MTVRVGLVGAGRIGSLHAHNISAHPRLTLVAVHDALRERATSLAGRHGARAAATVEELLGARDIDAIIVASSTDTHSTIGLAAARAGKAIYWEKPIDLDLKTAFRTVSAVRAAAVPVMLGFNRRFDSVYNDLHMRIRDGKLGRIQILQITSRGPNEVPPPDYIRKSGGIYRDKTVHFFDLMRFLLGGEAEEISVMSATLADSYIGELGDCDTCIINIRMVDGTLCQIDNTRRAVYGFDECVEAFGSLGMLETARTKSALSSAGAHGSLGTDYPQGFMDRFAAAFAGAIDGFAQMLLDQRKDVPSLQDGLEAQILAEAAELAARAGRTVKLSEIRKTLN